MSNQLTSPFAVDVRDLRYSYSPNKKRKEDHSLPEVLQGLTFQVGEGRVTALLGPNGSGKSTTFKILSTQLTAQEGSATVFGKDIRQARPEVREFMGVTFQSPSLDPMLTVDENLEIFGTLYGLSAEVLSRRIHELLKMFQLEDRASTFVKELSGGLARRAELAKALLPSPRLLMLDEPTTGLDPKLRFEFWKELLKLKRAGMTVLVTTHLMDEADLCDDLIFIDQGKCVGLGTPDQMKSDFGRDILELTFRQGALPEKTSLTESLSRLLTGDEKWTLNENQLRVESSNAAERMKVLLEKWSLELQQVSWGKPTLNDVFFSKTGRALS
jgi:ABC-2 type transport system ATP-binding protein